MSILGPVPAASYGALAPLVAGAAGTSRKLQQLTEEASSGSVATTYTGLGAGASISLDLNPMLDHLQTWQDNIAAATGNMQVTQTAMTQIQQIASNLFSQLNALQGADGSEIDSIAATARDNLAQVASLLDTTNGNIYVFAGTDTGNPPVPDPDTITSSGFFTQIVAAVANLGAAGPAATAAATLAVASSNAPGTTLFSATIGPGAVIQTGSGETRQIGLLANANTAVASTGPSTTGSYMRDLMRALATVGSLSSAQQSDPGLAALVQDTRQSLSGAISAMAQDTGVLGDRQTELSNESQALQQTATALKTQLSGVQDADMASVLSQITQVQTQLQASYQLISAMSGLSLAKFLPPG